MTQPVAPPAFVCTGSQQLMKDPVLALCGHLFEREVAQKTALCPVDRTPINSKQCLPFAELKQAIQAWSPPAPAPASTASTSGGGFVVKQSRQAPKPLKVVTNAHRDDIHGFVSISSTTFVSGSKDTDLKIWDHQGKLVKVLDTNLAVKGYRYWVTALTSFGQGMWGSGTRDGYVTVWNAKGEVQRTIQYQPGSGTRQQTVAKQRNKSRINCLTQLPSDQGLRFLTGTPKFIQQWNGDTGLLEKYYEAHANDWVYCIEVLSAHAYLVVIGSDLEHWTLTDASPDRASIIEENPADRKGKQRPHISAIQRLEHDPNLLANALFDGSVRVADIAAQKQTLRFQGHQGRVWSAINLRPQVLASSADDGTIKLWDVRQTKPVRTIGKQPGRVSSLLRLSANLLISGSCPDDVHQAKEKASISFWDIRQL